VARVASFAVAAAVAGGLTSDVARPAGGGEETGRLWISKAPPRAGRVFVGIVFQYPAEATYAAARFSCGGSIERARVPVTVTTFPEGAPVPAVTVCAWQIPRRSAGKRFMASYSSTVTERDGRVTHADGVPHSWRIVR
jgi:hypothetical protein